MIQNLFKCKHYTKNENMNKTCKNKTMCKIYYDEVCKEYKEKKDERVDDVSNPNNATCNNNL